MAITMVRCKDCKYCDMDRYSDPENPYYLCLWSDELTDPEHYCVLGDVRESYETEVPKVNQNLVEVVRCKDCKFYLSVENCPIKPNAVVQNRNSFCSWGERREDAIQ